ncbi:MAG: NAD(P)-dependent oxidoreductase [Thermomicrobiales bacterium]|nr:NAD(P)-dependent oxidoreductase [Thermomicrobiales bacterium]
MTTLVTGGNGWVPSHVVRRLAERGERVVSYDVMEPDALLLNMLDGAGEIIFEHGDVVSEERMLEVARQYGVSRIVHAAAITPRLHREKAEPRRIIEVNLLGTVAALDVARQLPGFERLVYVSSCAAWGPHPDEATLTEDMPSHAAGLYGVTKHTSERVCRRYAELFDVDAVSVRLANVFGPMERDTPGYQGGTEPREMLRIHFGGQPVRINSLEGPWLDWTYVEDVAEGIETAWATRNLPHDCYAITCGHLYSIGDVLEAFARHLPGFRYEVVPETEANYLVAGGPPGPVPTYARMQTDTGWSPRTSFDEGMRRYLDWIQRNGPQ